MTQLKSRSRLKFLNLTIAALATAFTFADEALTAPRGMILTWQGDPTTTMTIDWHLMPDQAETPALIQARPCGTQEWRDFPAERFPFPHSDRLIDRIEITGLKPATEYEFRGCPASKVYWFRTMPKTLVKPLVIAAGGDVRHQKSWMDQSNRAVMAHDPDFVVWGGDLAYDDGSPDQVNRWYEFLDSMVTTLVTIDGRVPPVLVCIGNHELPGAYHKGRIKSEADRANLAPYFYSLLAFPGQPGYGVVDFGNYLSLVFGDSEHTNPIPGKQTDWMRETLAARKNVPHLIPVYHCAAWPSARPFENEVSKIIRDEWVPLFEQNGIRLALENHDHTYKRTVPIFEGKENTEKGVIYIGDGSWGVDTKKAHDVDKTWYLERAQSTRHALIITLHSDRQEVTAITPDGKEIDTITIPAR
jgi:acid phosphatase type 7